MNHYPIVRPSLLSQALAGDWPGTDSMLRPESASTVVYAAASKQTVQLEQQLRELQLPPSPRMAEPARKRSLEENLFDATAAVKTLTSQVAMHLDREWRAKLFRQLDSLHDPAEWEAGDIPVQKASFATFLKAICDIRPARRPGLGLTSSGCLIAAWTTARKDKLTIEFLPNDQVRFVLSLVHADDTERIAAKTNVARLRERLSQFGPDRWFDVQKA
ncbi:MAG: hypothetical protein IPH39_08395 [Sulfuritalea sp.]|jgi:hypothetical protein|nr:hypothetical protein [Sulfuritalea sp.]MBK8759651.1 hypothetical protein [Sulfuritalea sp.]MBK9351247.1 hypothetical protein [Sulfuritalea sp.]